MAELLLPGGKMLLKPRELEEMLGVAGMARAAALSPAELVQAATLAEKAMRLREKLAQRIAHYDIALDLAEEIGSARWFRGLGAMLGLGLAASLFWPDTSAVAAPAAMPLDIAQRDEFRSQMILPLALGADSGRRMGASAALVPIAAAPERPTVQLVATLGQGDSFARMLTRAGVSESDAGEVTRLVAGAIPVSQIAPGTQVDVVLGPRRDAGAGRRLERLAFRARFDLDLSVGRADGQLAIQPQPIAVDTTPLRIRGTVGMSIYRSARAAGAPIEAIQQYLHVLDQHLSLDTAIGNGDTFDIIVGYKRSASGESQVGELLFAGLERGGKPQAQLLRWGSDGQFFEASGMGAQRTGLLMPVVGRITSNFGARRHPILGYTRMHSGVDFGAAHGSPIYAVGDAAVSYSGWRGGHGNYVRLDHGGGYGTGYAHMSRIAVSSGTRVRAGQVIGYVGSTGLSTGPHLHYELYRNGAAVNPLSVRFTVSNQVDPAELKAYRARMAELKGVAAGAAMASLAPRQAAAQANGLHREIDRLGN